VRRWKRDKESIRATQKTEPLCLVCALDKVRGPLTRKISKEQLSTDTNGRGLQERKVQETRLTII